MAPFDSVHSFSGHKMDGDLPGSSQLDDFRDLAVFGILLDEDLVHAGRRRFEGLDKRVQTANFSQFL